jgi:hypothetical protein
MIEVVPGARRMAMPADANATQHLEALQDAGRAGGIELAIFNILAPEGAL